MEKELIVKIQKKHISDVYVSCSWQPDAGKDAAYALVKDMDNNGIRAVGDVFDQPDQDEPRLARIMSDCSGFLVVLPYRERDAIKTSPYIIREIELALKQKKPICLVTDSRINNEIKDTNDGKILRINFIKEIKISKDVKLFHGVRYTSGNGNLEKQLIGKIDDFVELVKTDQKTVDPFVFLITRLEDDFDQARCAIKTTVENETGMPCLWSDDRRHVTNVDGIRERTKLLIKASRLVVADLTLDDDWSSRENPSRVHEVGIAKAYNKSIILTSQNPRRIPYFSINDDQMIFWNNEKELCEKLSQWLKSNEIFFSRGIYNSRLKEKDKYYTPKIENSNYEHNSRKAYIGPKYNALTTFETFVIAFSLAIIVFMSSLIVPVLTDYQNILDLAPILAAIFTFFFVSNLSNHIRKILSRYTAIRWLIPFISLGLILLYFIIKA